MLQSIAEWKANIIYLMQHDAIHYITKIKTSLICNVIRPYGGHFQPSKFPCSQTQCAVHGLRPLELAWTLSYIKLHDQESGCQALLYGLPPRVRSDLHNVVSSSLCIFSSGNKYAKLQGRKQTIN